MKRHVAKLLKKGGLKLRPGISRHERRQINELARKAEVKS